VQYLTSSDRAAFAAAYHHPDLPQELLRCIENSDPALMKLVIWSKYNFKEAGCRVLARALSLNTCITSLDLEQTTITPAGAALLCPSLTHLTAMTYLNFCRTDLRSSGASYLISILTHLTAMTELNLSFNKLTADDGARMCGAAAAAGMTRLKVLDLRHNPSYENPFSASSVVGCGAWRQLNLPQPPHDFVEIVADVLGLVQYLTSSDRAAFAAAYPHPDLPQELLQRIENSDPALTELEIREKSNFKEAGCRILARALSLNTCITSLDLGGTSVTPAGAALLFPALMHLTAMTYLNLGDTDLHSSGASHLCRALAHLTAMTELWLGGNELTADDGARICGAAAAAGMTRLKVLDLSYNPSIENAFSASSVVGCGAWRQLNLPQPPDEIVRQCSSGDYYPLVSYLLSEDKVASHAIRIFVVGESTVRPPLPPTVALKFRVYRGF